MGKLKHSSMGPLISYCESWIQVVNKMKCITDGNDTQFLYDTGESPHITNCDEMLKTQDKERWIKVVKDMLAEKADMRKADRQQLPHQACVFFKIIKICLLMIKEYSIVKHHPRSKSK